MIRPARPIELEKKFMVPSLARLTRMQSALIGARISVPGIEARIFDAQASSTKPQLDTYYDSADLGFYTLHCGTLRLRDKGNDLQVTFKQPKSRIGEISQRSEAEVQIARAELMELETHPLFAEARNALGVSELFPILTVDNLRTTFLFSHAEGNIEVCLDHIRQFTDIRRGVTKRSAGPDFELEIENKTAPFEVFKAFIEALTTLADFRGLDRSTGGKYERGVRALGLNLDT